jgi:hypothetical protein
VRLRLLGGLVALLAVGAGCAGSHSSDGAADRPPPPPGWSRDDYFRIVETGRPDRNDGQITRTIWTAWLSPASAAYRTTSVARCRPGPCRDPYRTVEIDGGGRVRVSFDSYAGKDVRIGPRWYLGSSGVDLYRRIVGAYLEGRRSVDGLRFRVRDRGGKPCLVLLAPEAPGCTLLAERRSLRAVRRGGLLRADPRHPDSLSRLAALGRPSRLVSPAYWLGPGWRGWRARVAVDAIDERVARHWLFYLRAGEAASSHALPAQGEYADREIQLSTRPRDGERVPPGGRPVVLADGTRALVLRHDGITVVTPAVIVQAVGAGRVDPLEFARALRPL